MAGKNLPEKLVLLLVWSSGLLFILYLLTISYFTRPGTDEYCHLYLVNKFGLWQGMAHIYYNMGARIASNFLLLVIPEIYQVFESYLPVYLVVIPFQFFTTYIIFKQLIQSKYLLLVTACISLFLFIFTLLPQDGFDNYFWTPALVTYFLNFSFFQLLLYSIFFVKKNVHAYILLVFSALYSFTSVENIAASNFLILGCVFIYFLLKKLNPEVRNRLFVSLIAGAIFILVMYFAPSTFKRQNDFQQISFLSKLFNWQKETYSFFFWILPSTFNYYFFLIPVMIFLGTISRIKLPGKIEKSKLILYSGIFTVVLIWLSIFPNVYAMNEIGPKRAYSHLYYYGTVYIAFASFIIGNSISEFTEFSKKIALFTIAVFTLSTLDYFRINIPLLKIFKASYVERLNLIENHKTSGSKQALYLPPLTDVDIIPYSINIMQLVKDSTDKNYWQNQCVENALDLDFKIYEQKQTKELPLPASPD